MIRTLNAAARTEIDAAIDKDYADMIAASAQEVLALFAQIAERELDLQIVQKIESDSYWIHYHSPSDAVRSAALVVKAIIDANSEYSILLANLVAHLIAKYQCLIEEHSLAELLSKRGGVDSGDALKFRFAAPADR